MWPPGKTDCGGCKGGRPRGCRPLVKMGCDTGGSDTAPAESCCVLRHASAGVSSAALTLLEQVGEAGPDPQLFAPM